MSISTVTTVLDLLLTLICFYTAVIFSSRAYRGKNWMLVSFGIALWTAGGYFGIQFASSYADFGKTFLENLQGINSWLNIIAIAAVYSGLMHLIRNEKPAVARFPLIFTALPLLIVLTYPLSHSANAIYNWLLKIYQGGALTVAALFFGWVSIARGEFRGYLISAYLLWLGSYISYWFLADTGWMPESLWKILLAVGLILFYQAFRRDQQ